MDFVSRYGGVLTQSVNFHSPGKIANSSIHMFGGKKIRQSRRKKNPGKKSGKSGKLGRKINQENQEIEDEKLVRKIRKVRTKNSSIRTALLADPLPYLVSVGGGCLLDDVIYEGSRLKLMLNMFG